MHRSAGGSWRKEDKEQSRARAALPPARPGGLGGAERWPLSPGSNVLRLALARRPSPLLSLALGSWEPGLGLPVGQTDKVHEAPGCGGGGVGQLAGGFGVGEWQQGDILAGPAVAGEGAPLAMGVKASGLWVDFRAFSWAGSSSSRGWSSSFRCWEGGGHSAWLPAPLRALGLGVGGRVQWGLLGQAKMEQTEGVSSALGPPRCGRVVPGTGWPAAVAAGECRAPVEAGTATASRRGAGQDAACGRWGPGPHIWGATARPGP